MVNTLRYKILKETTENAIRRYSETTYAAAWLNLVEDEVYYQIKLNDWQYVNNFYTTLEVQCMRDLIREGMWVKWVDGEIRLCRCGLKHMGTPFELDEYADYDNHVNGAD
jgi:hypothetical protein